MVRPPIHPLPLSHASYLKRRPLMQAHLRTILRIDKAMDTIRLRSSTGRSMFIFCNAPLGQDLDKLLFALFCPSRINPFVALSHPTLTQDLAPLLSISAALYALSYFIRKCANQSEKPSTSTRPATSDIIALSSVFTTSSNFSNLVQAFQRPEAER